jgi:transcriptional regulator with XRE-family HTH domain
MATIPVTPQGTLESREVLRCERCQLVQFRSHTGNCRRCHKALEPEELPLPAIHLHTSAPAAPQELDVARAVRSLRHARSLSQRQLAARMSVPRTYISKIENGKAMPTLSSLERLANALEAKIGDLLHDDRSRRANALAAITADSFLCEVLPLTGRVPAAGAAEPGAGYGARFGFRPRAARAGVTVGLEMTAAVLCPASRAMLRSELRSIVATRAAQPRS